MKTGILPTTLWQQGPLRRGNRLIFGRMFEDCSIECSQFSPGGKIFCIASAGCTALALCSQGRRVDLVDINPAQIEYVRMRTGGGAMRDGTVDRILGALRSVFIPLVGTDRVREFLMLRDPEQQWDYYRSHFTNMWLRRCLDLAVNKAMLSLLYRRHFARVVPRSFARVLRSRFERCIRMHPNRTNPYLWNLLLGGSPEASISPAPITIPPREYCADAAAFLESCPEQSYDGFSLSNILDGADAAYRERLWRAIDRAAAPGAVVILRSLDEPANAVEDRNAVMDRSMLWGSIRIDRIHSQRVR